MPAATIIDMPSRERPLDRGRQHAAILLHELGRELREARVAAGLSQRDVARAASMSPAQVSRLERALSREASVRSFAVLFSVLGQRLTARPYPNGDPIRDAAHARVMARLRALLPAHVRLRTEVPLGTPGDLRAWDAELWTGGERCCVEVETALRDLQATDRRIARKMQDGAVDRVILVVADTVRNRRALLEFRELLRDRYPLDSRAVRAALRAGRCPDRSGVLVL